MKAGDTVEVKATGRVTELIGEGRVAVVEVALDLGDGVNHTVNVYAKVPEPPKAVEPEPITDTLEETDGAD